MAVESINPHAAPLKKRGTSAMLYLDGKLVGLVDVKGFHASWGHGEFQPHEAFSPYAGVFGHWSLLMHADGEDHRLSREASRELSQAEQRLDALEARLFFIGAKEWVEVAQLTIDGNLLEWKEY